jgi:hypothetical protein
MNNNKPQVMVWWALWAAFQTGIFFIYHFLRTPAEPAPDPSPVWLAGAVPFLLSVVVRWAVLPRVSNAQLAFQLFVAGIALAETSCFMGLFIFPAHRAPLFYLSAAGIFQFLPTFASRFCASATQPQQNSPQP